MVVRFLQLLGRGARNARQTPEPFALSCTSEVRNCQTVVSGTFSHLSCREAFDSAEALHPSDRGEMLMLLVVVEPTLEIQARVAPGTVQFADISEVLCTPVLPCPHAGRFLGLDTRQTGGPPWRPVAITAEGGRGKANPAIDAGDGEETQDAAGLCGSLRSEP